MLPFIIFYNYKLFSGDQDIKWIKPKENSDTLLKKIKYDTYAKKTYAQEARMS